AMVVRTPKGAARPVAEVAVTTGNSLAESGVVLESVSDALGALLDLDVPTTAVASGLVWQFALLAAPSLISRRREIFDIVGAGPDEEVGDDTFRFRSDATGLSAGPVRRRDGRWVRSVVSPRGPVWIPTANLRRSEAGR
ncbi:MAG: hypothetical protein AAF081_15520, partial [Actinomycetota bacterium]